VAEGGATASYAVCLRQQPSQNVVATPQPDAQQTTAPGSVTFTSSDWQLPKFVTVTAVDDAVDEGNHTGSIGHSLVTNDPAYAGFTLGGVTVNIADNDAVSNVPPNAVNDQANTTRPNAVVISVLANDSDGDGGVLSVVGVSQPAHGNVAISGGGQTVTYTPNAGYQGPDNFTYTISDGQGGSAMATVTVTVSPAAPPTGADIAIGLSVYVEGRDVRLTIQESNLGPNASIAPRIRVPLVGGLSYKKANGATCTVSVSQGYVECVRGRLNRNQTRSMSMLFRAAAPGTYTVSGQLVNQTADPNPSNNQASVSAIVQ
jgi:hypothetical protein